jgi:hypothetical protein
VRLLVELLERIDGRQDGVEDVLDLCEPCSEEVSSEFRVDSSLQRQQTD